MDRPSGFLRRPRRTFRDRREAGRVLAEELASYRGKAGLLVLGLARGGIPVGWEVAAALGAELDVFLVRKLGVPQWSELAMGALASGDVGHYGDAVAEAETALRLDGITPHADKKLPEAMARELRTKLPEWTELRDNPPKPPPGVR